MDNQAMTINPLLYGEGSTHSKTMKSFVLKATFNQVQDLKNAVEAIRALGIRREQIDYVTKQAAYDKGIVFQRTHKGSIVALRLMPFGFLLGLAVYPLYLSSYQVAPEIKLIDFIWSGLIAMLFGMFILVTGYMFGRRMSMHIVQYSKYEESEDDSIILAVNLEHTQIEKAESILLQCQARNIDVINLKQEVELGLRKQ